jgi:hypothetical protein
MNTQTIQPARFSVFSIIAIICALASFTTGAFWGFVLAGFAILCGFIGVVLSFSSRTRGGFISMLSLVAGFAGIVAAVIKLLRVIV